MFKSLLKSNIFWFVTSLIIAFLVTSIASGASVLFPYQGGTGTNATTTKGALLIGSSTNAYSVLLPGTNGQLVRASSTAPKGLEWFTPSYIALSALSASSPLFYDNTTGIFTIQAASSTDSGYLTSTDWNIFNNKISNPLTSDLFGGTYNIFDITNIGSSSARVGKIWTTDLDSTTANIGTLTISSLATSPLLVGGSATTTIYGDGTQSVFGGGIRATNTSAFMGGNVGIGTSTPQTTLHVVGSSTISNGLTLGGLTNTLIWADSTGKLIATTTASGITSLNSSTSSTQTFALASSSNAFSIGTSDGVHTFTFPNNIAWFTNDANYIDLTDLSSSATGLTYNNITGAFSWTAGYEGLTTTDKDNWNSKATSSLILTAGAGLTGGGDLTTSRTFTVGAGTNIVVNADDVAVTSTPSFSQVTLTGDNNAIKYGEKVLCNLMFSYTTSTSSWYDDCFVPATSTITRVKSKVQDGSVTWNLFYKNTATTATTTGMYPVFSSNQTSNTTTTVIATPTASSTPNDADFIRVYATNASSTLFSIQILGKDR